VLGGSEVRGHDAEDETLQYECDQDTHSHTYLKLLKGHVDASKAGSSEYLALNHIWLGLADDPVETEVKVRTKWEATVDQCKSK
jgi:hypothetical protein